MPVHIVSFFYLHIHTSYKYTALAASSACWYPFSLQLSSKIELINTIFSFYFLI